MCINNGLYADNAINNGLIMTRETTDRKKRYFLFCVYFVIVGQIPPDIKSTLFQKSWYSVDSRLIIIFDSILFVFVCLFMFDHDSHNSFALGGSRVFNDKDHCSLSTYVATLDC